MTITEVTLFEKYGGFASISSLVHEFYEKVLDMESLESYFQGINLERLIWHQTHFFCRLMGGPQSGGNRDLKVVHAKLGITAQDFATVADLLEETLEEGGIEYEDIDRLMEMVGALKPLIVSVNSLSEKTS